MKNKIRMDVELREIILKKARKFSNSAHVIMPKKYINKKIIIGLPKRQPDLKMIQESSSINLNMNPDLICPECGKPWGRPAGKDFEDMKTCDCK